MVEKLFLDQNIERLGSFVDKHLSQKNNIDETPPISIIEFSINGACNRRCHFCPRVSEANYPNIYISLNMVVYENLLRDLQKINFDGRFTYSGFSEPLLTKNLDQYVSLARNYLPNINIGIVSNGDSLLGKNAEKKLRKLYEAGLNDIKISLYDGPEQRPYFIELQKKLNLNDNQYIIRDRFLSPEKSYGITISNRAGSVSLKNDVFELKPLTEPLKKPCHYPFFKVLIDYNGDVLMCSNDWKKEKIHGNINSTSLVDIWKNESFLKKRKKLICGNREDKPCNVCDVDGTLNGKASFDRWKNYLSK